MGLSQDEGKQLQELSAIHASFLIPLLQYLLQNSEVVANKQRCPGDWTEFISALASSSPVCALIHPGNELQQVLTTIAGGFSDLDMYTLQFLQQQCPLLLNLLQRIKPPERLISSVLHELLKKACAPFSGSPSYTDSRNSNSSPPLQADDCSYFPALPMLRCRGSYVADRVKSSKMCTKRGTNHPTLLPGIFTVFCSHGNPSVHCKRGTPIIVCIVACICLKPSKSYPP